MSKQRKDLVIFIPKRHVLTHFTWHLLKKTYLTVSNQKKDTFGKKLGKMTTETLSKQMQNLISFP